MDEDRRVFFAVKIGQETIHLIIKLSIQSRAHQTIKNFYELIKSNSYKNTEFHRIISPEFIIQGGGITGFQGELLRSEDVHEDTTKLDRKGLIVVASDVYQDKSSEFFITLKDLSEFNSLQGRFIVLGELENKSLDKLIELTKDLQVDDRDKPLERVSIIKTGELQKKKKQPSTEQEEVKEKCKRKRHSSRDYDDRSHRYHESTHHHRSEKHRDEKDESRHHSRHHSTNHSHRSRYDKDYSDRDNKRLKKSNTRSQDEVRKGRGFK
ncbi:Peptidyl-prolyl cis-trans isomerase B1 [Wickerhamomyces ciferrii]|uniref:peptidylprolyl isomerase n=1 Tax=Wickerhamomyces ciferrii (strain ATCC 14091 / BCRC 22168 / CBS 111 / JCM 3599 / NBRC 0793 / NRRL Y-1031 F-60-10) TaxID=1206466 RepID=K0KJ45_WICCF|nr:Peptidyl-prolyl cis-trans isomerase B1 [Wickerhamomyces ciferrii]CCH42157.1 Peptidyl-prolyl cis-trans isomerase B1 [Wickerhamomyces ciferrii]